MDNATKKLTKNAAVYGVFSLLQKGFGFFLLPLYTTVLTANELGIISTSSAVISFLAIVFGLSLRGSTAYYYYKFKDSNPELLKRLYGTSFITILSFSLLMLSLLLVFKTWTLDNLFYNIPFYPYVLLSLFSICLQPIYLFYQSLLKAKQEAKKSATLDFLYFGFMIGLTIVFILFLDFKAEGALLAGAIANFIVVIVSVNSMTKDISFHFDLSLFKMSMKYSLPILPHNISGWAMNMIDKLMLNSMNSLSVVALFDVGSQLGKIVNIISLGVNSAYSPWFFNQVNSNKNNKRNIAKITYKIIVFYCFIAVVVSWLSPEIFKLISRTEYHDSWRVVPFISIAFVINGFYFSYSNVFFLDNTKYLPLITIFGAICNIVLNYFMIRSYGIMGAALSSLFTKIIFATITYIISQKLYYIPYNIKLITLTILFSFLITLTLFYVQPKFSLYNVLYSLLIKSAVILLIMISLILFNLDLLKDLLRKRNEK